MALLQSQLLLKVISKCFANRMSSKLFIRYFFLFFISLLFLQLHLVLTGKKEPFPAIIFPGFGYTGNIVDGKFTITTYQIVIKGKQDVTLDIPAIEKIVNLPQTNMQGFMRELFKSKIKTKRNKINQSKKGVLKKCILAAYPNCHQIRIEKINLVFVRNHTNPESLIIKDTILITCLQ